MPAVPPQRTRATTPHVSRGRTTIQPTGIERPYGREEIIVSKTNPKGVITYANDIFLRVAGYTEQETLGQPHSLIRHPDTPRAVFKVMWDTLGAGNEIFAYVLNLGADGGHYWVLAHVTPTFDSTGQITGFHSNRRWVEPDIRREVAAVYAKVRRAEQAQARTPDAITAGVEALHHELTAAGHNLDTWVWSLAGRELEGRR
jgi:PAS domain S-box-containing protein